MVWVPMRSRGTDWPLVRLPALMSTFWKLWLAVSSGTSMAGA